MKGQYERQTRGRRRWASGWARLVAAPVAVAVVSVAQPWVTSVEASTASHPAIIPVLSPSDYPAGTQLQYFPQWTNEQFDCNFGWFCEYGTPFTHLKREDALHRASGWALWGEWHNDAMGFELYSSTYSADAAPAGSTWNQQAAADEQQALRLQGAHLVTVSPAVLSSGVAGGTFAMHLTRIGLHMLFITAWWGTSHEVEGAALYPARRSAEARRYLITQVRAAIQLASRSPSQ